MNKLRRETWTIKGVKRHVLVVRNNGRIATWTKVKGKNQFTLRQFKENVKTTGSFKQNVKSVTMFENKNRVVVTKERQTGKQNLTQIFANVEFGRVLKTGQRSRVTKIFTGFSKLGERGTKARHSAVQRATNQAVVQGFANYDKLFIVNIEYEFHNWKRRGESFTTEEQLRLNEQQSA